MDSLLCSVDTIAAKYSGIVNSATISEALGKQWSVVYYVWLPTVLYSEIIAHFVSKLIND